MAEIVGVFGAGALGTLLAARLSRAGHSVRILARAPVRRETLRRDHPDLHVEDRAAGLSPAPLVFLCVKSYDTEAASLALAEAGVSSGICSLQNGWGHMEILEAALPKSPLIVGATLLGAYLEEHGALRTSSDGPSRFAPWGDTEYRWAEYAAILFESAGLKAHAHHDAPGVIWRKLVMSAAVNPVSALSGVSNGAILESASMLPAAEAAASEAARVGARLGHLEPGSDPRPELRQLLHLTAENRSSMAEDLARGRRTEIDAIVGSVVRAARGVGEPVPELERLWAAVLAREATARQGSA